MSFEFSTERWRVTCTLNNTELQIQKQETSLKDCVQVNDIIGVTTSISTLTDTNGDYVHHAHVHTIQKSNSKVWTKNQLTFNGEKTVCERFILDMESRVHKLTRPKKLLILISPVAGSHEGERIFYDRVKPLFDLANISTDVIISEYTTHIRELLSTYDLENIDGIAVCGGDGSFNQCLNAMFERTQKAAKIDYNKPEVKLSPLILPIAQIPTGTKNFVSLYCYGCLDIETATLHIIRGLTRTLGITNVYSNNKWIGCCFIATGYGLLTDFLQYAEGFRWMKTMRYLVLPLYYFSVKTIPLFDATIKLRYRDGKEVIKTGQFMDVIASLQEPFRLDVCVGSKLWNEDYINIRLYHPASRYQLWKHWMNNLIFGPRYVSPEFIEQHEATAVNLTVNNTNIGQVNLGGTRYRILLDGEKLELDRADIDFRVKEPMATVFCSL